MTFSNTFVFVVLFYTFTVSESFTGVKLWRSDGRDIDKKGEHILQEDVQFKLHLDYTYL